VLNYCSTTVGLDTALLTYRYRMKFNCAVNTIHDLFLRQGVSNIGGVNPGLAVAHAAARRTRTRASSAPQRLPPWP
jgi:hypothetical protein